MNHPTHIVLHTLGFTGEADIDRVRDWHKERGFRDVGYHYLIRRSGERQKGREEYEDGAHAKDGGFNRKSIGIALEGHGDSQMHSYAQIRELFHLCNEVMDRYDIAPHNVIGHRETGAAKTCPGTLVNMDDLRALLFDYLPGLDDIE